MEIEGQSERLRGGCGLRWPVDQWAPADSSRRDRLHTRVSILTGNGALFLDFEMDRGADGAMTGYAFPDMLVDMVQLSREGRRDAAHDLFDAHLPLIRYEQQQGVGLSVRKYLMKRRGILSSVAQRKPGSNLSATAIEESNTSSLVWRDTTSGQPSAWWTKPLRAFMADYDAATQQYGVIVRYLKAAIEVLPKAECQLLLEFAENLFLMRHDHAADS